MKEKLLGFLAFIVYRLYSYTFRYRVQFADLDVRRDVETKSPSQGNYLYAFWHQDELSLVSRFSNLKMVAMVSLSKDGTIMSTALKAFGYITVRGSSSRGGAQGFLEALRYVKNDHKLVMAVDGPRGPIYKSKEGIIKLSEMSGCKIVPLRAFPESCHVFEKSWNKARLPFPFSKIKVVFGKPEFYKREELDLALNSITG